MRFTASFVVSSLLLAPAVSAVCLGASSDSQTCSNRQELHGRATPKGDKYLIGVGKADITGPIVELTLAGYGKFEQSGSGLRQRLYSRAFVVADVKNPSDRIAYLVLDDLAGDTAVRYGLLEAMAAMGGDYALYNGHNIAMTATHTHSGPGGWFNYLIPQAPTFGLDKQSYQAIVDGAALSIKRAHDSLEEVSETWGLLRKNTLTSKRDILMLPLLKSLMLQSTARLLHTYSTRKKNEPDTHPWSIPP